MAVQGARADRIAASAALEAPREYGPFALAMLLGGLSMSLLVFLPGAYLVPALSLRAAITVAVLGSIAGAGIVAAVATVAARRRRNTVGLLSSTFGMPAGPLFAVLLFARHTAWALFTIAFASEVASMVPGLGGAQWLWIVALSALALALALMPAHVFVTRWMGWFAFWVSLVMIALITLTGITTYGLPVLHDADGMGGWPTWAQGFDLIAAMPLVWAPIVADYAMDARKPRDAALGAGMGSAAATAWYAIIGLLWVFTVNSRDVAGFITALPLGAGGLVIVIALEADAVAANARAASLAGGRFGYRYFTPALVASVAVAAAVALAWDGFAIEDALATLGAIFLPLMTVVVAREFIGPAPRAFAWAAWIAGALCYGWINPGDYAIWHDTMDVIFARVLHAPFPLGGDLTSVPATAASFAVALVVYAAGAAVERVVRRPA